MEELLLADLVAETYRLRETILRRIAALGGPLDNGSVAELMVDSTIGEFLFASDYAEIRRRLVEGRADDSRALTLLVLECLAGIKSEMAQQRSVAPVQAGLAALASAST